MKKYSTTSSVACATSSPSLPTPATSLDLSSMQHPFQEGTSGGDRSTQLLLRAMPGEIPRKASAAMIHVGTAGWSISSKYKDALPGEGSHLQRYAKQFDIVEINTSFYKHHQPQTYARWAESVSAGFRFSLKTPNTMTHEGELIAHPEVLARFAEEVSQLGDKLAVILVQLPPKLEFSAADARRFFKAFQKRLDVPLVCEPRHPTWAGPEARAWCESLVGRKMSPPSPRSWPVGRSWWERRTPH